MTRLLSTAALALLAAPAFAQSINFDMEPVAGAVQPQANWGGSAGSPGLWNSILGAQGLYGNIVDANSNATTVTISLSNGNSGRCGVGCVGSGPAGSNNEALLDDYLRFNGNLTVTLRNLAGGTYDVYVYGWAPDSAQARTSVYMESLGGAWPANNAQVLNTHYARKQTVAVAAGNPLTIHLGVDHSFGTLNGLQIVHTATTIGTSYCPAMPNSSGEEAHMVAVGSPFALENFFLLGCANMPADSFCVFITSQTPTMTPASGMGYICVGGQVARGVGGQIFHSGPDGNVMFQADLSAQPTPMGTTAVVAGQTWFYQCWMRDSFFGTPTSITSDAVEVTYL